MGPRGDLVLATRSVDILVDGYRGGWDFGDTVPALGGNRTLCLAPAKYEFRTAGVVVPYTLERDGDLWRLTPLTASLTVPGGSREHTLQFQLGQVLCEPEGCNQFSGPLERINLQSDGGQSDGFAHYPSVSTDGRYVAFHSEAPNLVPGDTNDASDVFVRDRHRRQTKRVSIARDGRQASGLSYHPSLSGDGRFVAFTSTAKDLDPAAAPGTGAQIFVHDLATGDTRQISTPPGGRPPDGDSGMPAISADGNLIAFQSMASNLVAVDSGSVTCKIFVHNRTTGLTRIISRGFDGSPQALDSFHPAISADGRFIAFESLANNLVAVDTNRFGDIFVHDSATGRTELASVASDGSQANYMCYRPSLSGDGRFVAFSSVATNLIEGGTSRLESVYVHDRVSGATELLDMDAYEPQLSSDGRFVVTTGGELWIRQTVIHDLQAKVGCVVSKDSSGRFGNANSTRPVISADGSTVCFGSTASNLMPGDTNGSGDIFCYRLRWHLAPAVAIVDSRVVGSVRAAALSPACGLLPDCGIFSRPAFEDLPREIGERFAEPDFPKPERISELPGFSFFVRLDLTETVIPAGSEFFEPGDWSIEIAPSSGGGASPAAPGLPLQATTLSKFIEIGLDLDGSGSVGDSEGEGVMLFFAQTLDLAAALKGDPFFDLTIRNSTAKTPRQGAYQVTEPGSGLPPLPEDTVPPSEPPLQGCARPCGLAAGSATSVSLPPVTVRAARLGNRNGEIVAGQSLPASLAECDGEVGDLFIPESKEGEATEFASVDFSDACPSGGPRKVTLRVYGLEEFKLRAFRAGGAELGTKTVAAETSRAVSFADAGGVDRVEILGDGVTIIEICWDCQAEIPPSDPGCGRVADLSTAPGNVESLDLGPALIEASRSLDGATVPMILREPGGELVLLIPFSFPAAPGGGEARPVVITPRPLAGCGAQGRPRSMTVPLAGVGISIHAFDAGGTERASAQTPPSGDLEDLLVSYEGGIARVELYGVQPVIEAVCVDCELPVPLGPSRLALSDGPVDPCNLPEVLLRVTALEPLSALQVGLEWFPGDALELTDAILGPDMTPGSADRVLVKLQRNDPSLAANQAVVGLQLQPGVTIDATAAVRALTLQFKAGPAAGDGTEVKVCIVDGLGNPPLDTVVSLNVDGLILSERPLRNCSTVRVKEDRSPPKLTCPADFSAKADGPDGATVEYEVAADDDESVESLVCQPPSGSRFPVGRTDVVCVATDAAGNEAKCTFFIEVSKQGFRRADSNGDGLLDISDPVQTLTWLFAGGQEPRCLSAADANADGAIDISDAQYTLSYLFLGGPAPPVDPKDCVPAKP